MISDFRTDMHEADKQTNDFIVTVVHQLIALGIAPDGSKHDPAYSMSLAISIVSQVFLNQGGNIEAGEEIGEMVKQGVITTLQAYKQMGRITQRPPRGRLN